LFFVNVIIRDVQHNDALCLPFVGELCRDGGLRGLVAAVIANQADCLETSRFEATGNALKHLGEDRIRNTERAGKLHILARRIVTAFGHEGHHRRHQRVAELRGNARGRRADKVVVLSEHHMGAVLLDSSTRHNRDRETVFDGASDLNPSHVADFDFIGQGCRQSLVRERHPENGEGGNDERKY
jgi:hypothetical protein